MARKAVAPNCSHVCCQCIGRGSPRDETFTSPKPPIRRLTDAIERSGYPSGCRSCVLETSDRNSPCDTKEQMSRSASGMGHWDGSLNTPS